MKALGAINLCQLHCVLSSVAQKVQSPILHERLHTAPLLTNSITNRNNLIQTIIYVPISAFDAIPA